MNKPKDAASAQVREVEACQHDWVCGDNQYVSNALMCRKCHAIKPANAPESVPVAQGDMAHRLEGLARALQRRGYPDNAKLIREAIADHARIVAAMQLELDHRASVSQTWFDRFQTTEASLAACRALVPKWRETPPDGFDGPEYDSGVIETLANCADELEAALKEPGNG